MFGEKSKMVGFRGANGQPASSPFTNGPYIMDQHVTFSSLAVGNGGEGDVWFVDGTNGLTTNNGTGWSDALTTIQAAVDKAGPGDTIYITAKDITDFTGDPISYEENIIIPAATSSLSLIGVSRGRTQGGLPQLKDGAGTTAAILTIRAPGCLIMNLGFNGAGNTGGGVLLDDDYAAKSAFGTSIVGCHFKNCKGHATNGKLGGAIMWSAEGNAWQVLISGNRFYKNVCDINLLGTSSTVPQDVIIENNDFSAGSNSDAVIWCGGSGFGDGFVFKNNTLGLIPSLASGTIGVYFEGTTGSNLNATGVMVNNTFGSAGTTTGYGNDKATAKIGTGILLSNNYSSAGLIVREA